MTAPEADAGVKAVEVGVESSRGGGVGDYPGGGGGGIGRVAFGEGVVGFPVGDGGVLEEGLGCGDGGVEGGVVCFGCLERTVVPGDVGDVGGGEDFERGGGVGVAVEGDGGVVKGSRTDEGGANDEGWMVVLTLVIKGGGVGGTHRSGRRGLLGRWSVPGPRPCTLSFGPQERP